MSCEKQILLPWADSSCDKHNPGEAANCGEKAWAQTGTSIPTTHGCLRFQIFSVCHIKWLHWRQGHTHMLIFSCTDNLMLLSRCCTSRPPPHHHSPSAANSLSTLSRLVVDPQGGKWVTPLLSLDTIAFDTRWWEREQKGAQRTFSCTWAAGAGAPAALKGMVPLMVKSIRDGDSVARLQTVAIADYNSTTLLPQHAPHSSSSSGLPLLALPF